LLESFKILLYKFIRGKLFSLNIFANQKIITVKTKVLSHSDVEKIIKRMAYQIYENNFGDKHITLVGISSRGFEIAKLLQTELDSISNLKSVLLEITIVKENPSTETTVISPAKFDIKGTIVIIDDVLNTGRALVYAALPFLNYQINKLQVAVLVDRNHKKFPIAADYTGIQLNTTFQEHVSVEINKKKQFDVYLQ
jgi:pyrimidine operon attenuation protein/uracil phosphoribosyltransferase